MVCRCATDHEHMIRNNQEYARKHAEKALSKDLEISNLKKELAALTPDPTKWEFVDFLENPGYLIAKVKFTTCEHAGFGGEKVLVFRGTMKDAIKWRIMNPHFLDEDKLMQEKAPNEAPVPIARFPASAEGWEDAKLFTRCRVEQDSNIGKR